MGVDFLITLRILREDLEELRYLRKGRLINLAKEHFGQRLSEFFRRYPYNEWYPLNKAELAQYIKTHPETEPYTWQE